MVVATDRMLYVSTDGCLFQARANGEAYQAQPLPFGADGAMRWPVVVDCDDPRRLYAGTSKAGMFRSEDHGQTWREINQGIIYKEIWSIVQHPRTGELFVGTGPASVFKSLDRGETWLDSEQFRTMPESIDWTFPPPPHVAHVKGMALCAADPSVVWGALEEGWLVRSRDAGATWQTIKDGTEFDSHYVAIMPEVGDARRARTRGFTAARTRGSPGSGSPAGSRSRSRPRRDPRPAIRRTQTW
jgi:hypothetical protein